MLNFTRIYSWYCKRDVLFAQSCCYVPCIGGFNTGSEYFLKEFPADLTRNSLTAGKWPIRILITRHAFIEGMYIHCHISVWYRLKMQWKCNGQILTQCNMQLWICHYLFQIKVILYLSQPIALLLRFLLLHVSCWFQWPSHNSLIALQIHNLKKIIINFPATNSTHEQELLSFTYPDFTCWSTPIWLNKWYWGAF